MRHPSFGINKVGNSMTAVMNLRRALTHLLMLVAVLIMPAKAHGQETNDVALQAVWKRADRDNWYLRVITLEADTLQGRVRYAGDVARFGSIAIISPLSVERRYESGGGMLVGAAVGFLVGGVIGGGMAGNSEGTADVLPAVFGGGGLGLVIGLFAGNAIAPGRVEWRRVWPGDN